MQIVWHDEAEYDLLEGVLYYERRSTDLGLKFASAVDEAVLNAAADPLRYPIVRDELRRCPVAGFPYCVLFIPLTDVVHILVLRHHSRHPDYGLGRAEMV